MKKVVLLGAGYANMALIKSLPKKIFNEHEFLLISDMSLHYFSVLLHEVVSGACEKEITLPIKAILPKNVTFVEDRVLRIDKDIIRAKNNSYMYDVLVVALGFQSDDFGIVGIKEYADSIVNYKGALALRQKIFNSLVDYANGNYLESFNIAICGAGFTGIEFIGSFVEELPQICKNLNIAREKIKIICIEAMLNILPMFNLKLSSSAKTYLENRDVRFELGCKILECERDGVVVLKNGQREKINASLIVWTAGVKGSQVIEDSKFFTSKRSKVEVDAYLQPINQIDEEFMKNIFVVGDCAAIKDSVGRRFYPPTAQIAIKQGRFLARLLVEKLQNKNFSKEFSYKPKGTICSLGSQYGIGFVWGVNIRGKLAIWLKKIVEFIWRFELMVRD